MSKSPSLDPATVRLWVAAEAVVVSLVACAASWLAVASAALALGGAVLSAAVRALDPSGWGKVDGGQTTRRITSVVITGATGGIGEALALRYAGPGVVLALTGRNTAKLREVHDACEARGAFVISKVVDVVDAENLATWLKTVDDEYPFDLIIANAGVGGDEALQDVPIETRTQQMFAVNVRGVFNTIHPLLQRLKDRRCGQIAIVSSISALFAAPFGPMTAYVSSKVAISTYAQNLRGLLAPFGIKVSNIAPGFVRSNMTKEVEKRGSTPFILDAADAANIIRDQLQEDIPLITFPLPLHATIFVTRMFHPNLAEIVLGPIVRMILGSSD